MLQAKQNVVTTSSKSMKSTAELKWRAKRQSSQSIYEQQNMLASVEDFNEKTLCLLPKFGWCFVLFRKRVNLTHLLCDLEELRRP